MQYELKEIQKRIGTTFLYVTHDQGEALTMSDTIAVMNNGKIIQTGSPSEIYNYPSDIFVADFIGAGNFIKIGISDKESENYNADLIDLKYSQNNAEDKEKKPDAGTSRDNHNHANEFKKITCITESGGKIIHRIRKDRFEETASDTNANDMVFFIRPEKISLKRTTYLKTDNHDTEDTGSINGHHRFDKKDEDFREINFFQGIIESLIFEGPDIRLVINSEQTGKLKAEVKNERYFLGLNEGSSIDFFWGIEEGIVFFSGRT